MRKIYNMFNLTNEGIILPEKIDFDWNLPAFEDGSKFLTYIDIPSAQAVRINLKIPGKVERKEAEIWETDAPGTFKDYILMLEKKHSHPVMSLNHVIWLIEHKHELLNSEEKNDKNQYIGNFFFISKNELKDGILGTDIAIASVIRRNSTPKLEYGMRFYEKDDSRIWSAQKRKIGAVS